MEGEVVVGFQERMEVLEGKTEFFVGGCGGDDDDGFDVFSSELSGEAGGGFPVEGMDELGMRAIDAAAFGDVEEVFVELFVEVGGQVVFLREKGYE